MRIFLVILTCGVAVLAVGVALSWLLIEDGLEEYPGQKKAYAEFVLGYDSVLREWPFPVDPTVARRVERVQGSHDPDGECRSDSRGGFGEGSFAGDYSAQIVHYGPFFVPVSETHFHCDLSTTGSYLKLPGGDGPLSTVYGMASLAMAPLSLLTVPAVPFVLLIGGVWLRQRAGQRADRVVGLAAAIGGSLLLACFAALYMLSFF